MPHEKDPFPESPEVPARVVLITLLCGAGAIGVCVAGLGGYYASRAAELIAPTPAPFPAPQLETSLQRTPPDEPPTRAAAGIRIDQAMATIAARGQAAYDPLPEGEALASSPAWAQEAAVSPEGACRRRCPQGIGR